MKSSIIIAAVSALLFYGVAGIDYVAPLPCDLQKLPMFSAGIHTGAKLADAARAPVRFITAPAAAAVIRKHGLEPGFFK
jgi:molybdate transport system substrate-binding protein